MLLIMLWKCYKLLFYLHANRVEKYLCKHLIPNLISQSSLNNYEITLLSLKPATNKGRSFKEFEETTFCKSSGLESKPRHGRDIDTAGRASRVLEMTAVARLRNDTMRESVMSYDAVVKVSAELQPNKVSKLTQE